MFGRACIIFIISLSCLISCSTQSGLSGAVLETVPAPAAALQLTELPDMQDLPQRSGMIVGKQHAEPGNVLAQHPSAGLSASKVSLHSSSGNTSWVLWGWYGLSPSVFPERIEIGVQSSDEPYYVLLANFAEQRWQSIGPFTESGLQLDPSEYCDQVLGRDGTFYVTVLAASGSRPEITGVQLATSNIMDQPGHVGWTTASYGKLPGAIQVDWEPVANASEWRLLRSPCTDPDVVVDIPVDCCSYLDEAVVPGQAYHYRVIAANLHGTAQPGPRALGLAGSVSGLNLSGQLEYDEYHPAAGIELQLGNAALISSTDAEGSFRFSGLSPGIWTLWRVDKLPRSKLGQYTVTAAETSTGSISLSTQGTPDRDWYWIDPPQGFEIGNTTDNSITLRWDTAQHATGYDVYRGRFDDPFWAELEATTELTSVALMQQGSGRYYYWVCSREEREGFSRVSMVGQKLSHTFSDKGLQPDTIYVIPDRTEVHAGEIVTFTVMVHETLSPLNFVNSVRVTYEEGNNYILGSFNPGSIGGSANSADGIWQQVNPQSGFIPVDAKLHNEGIAEHGRMTLDFNVTPLEGQQIEQATGALFNFQLRVNSDINMSFQTTNVLLRTYYSDANQSGLFTWQHDDNMGMPVVRVIP